MACYKKSIVWNQVCIWCLAMTLCDFLTSTVETTVHFAGESSSAAAAWSREYFRTQPPIMPAQNWTDEYLQQQTVARPGAVFDDAWKTASMQPTELKWSAEYLADAERTSAMGPVEGGAAASSSMLDGVPDDAQLWNTEVSLLALEARRRQISFPFLSVHAVHAKSGQRRGQYRRRSSR